MTSAGAAAQYEVGVDIGGTFTDVVCRSSDGIFRLVKIPTTRANPSAGVLHAIQYMVKQWGISPERIERFVHGTTVATNAVLERKGAKIGLLTTLGFRDVLEIGRQSRRAVYSVVLKPETPGFLVPGALRREVPERLSAIGEVLVPLDENAVRRELDYLVGQEVQAIAVSFLFSFLNPMHERRVAEIVRESHPQLMVSLSCEVDPAFREYERTCITAFDAYLKPVIGRYLENMERDLQVERVGSQLQIMQSRGGIASSRIARRRPVRLFLSGPAAGVIGGRMAGEAAGFADLITIDIGGTSADIALVARGKPLIAAEGMLDGYAVRVPMVDVNSIGAGGGSIAWLDGARSLRVGPASAGSEPGPACYGRGGEAPTVTDASIVLGYIDPYYFAGGLLTLKPELAWKAIEQKIAIPLGLPVEQAALGIHRVVNANMAEGIRFVSVKRGIDPRQFTLVPLGGGGPVHATALARDLGMRRIIVPLHPGVLSADGLLAAPVEHEAAIAFNTTLESVTKEQLARAYAALDEQCTELMRIEGIKPARVDAQYYADVCYVGQSFHLEIPVTMDENPVARLRQDFYIAHDRIYGHSVEGAVKFVNLRAVHQAVPNMRSVPGKYAARDGDASKGVRRIYTAAHRGFVDAQVYDRSRIKPGTVFEGPAIVEQADTTTVIDVGWRAAVDPGGCLVLTIMELTKDADAFHEVRCSPLGHVTPSKQTEREKPINTTGRAEVIDPITTEVIRNKLEGIANEMELTLLKSSFSPIVKEGLDTSASLFTVNGETLAQACAIPVHLATLIPALETMVKKYPIEVMREGDAFILNDPYCGGTHLPDIAIMTPVFHQGKVIAMSATMTHHGDIGGFSPGSLPTNSTEIYQEGLRIPALRFREAGVYNETLVALLRQNSRLPDMLMGDLNAQLAACNVGARRLQELADAYDNDFLMAIFEELLDRSEIMTREALRRIPQGTYRYVDHLDNDGIDLDRAIRIEVAVTFRDGAIAFDLAGTDPQVKGPLNCVPSGSQAAAYFAVRALTEANIPTNGGCFRPVTLKLPEGSLANPIDPAPVNARNSTIKRIATSMVSALAKALPERVGAPAAGTLLVLAFGGKRASGDRFIVGELVAGGSGAADGNDGVDVVDTDASNCMNLPVEALEMDVPIRLHRVALRCDSGGAGEFRGGLGVVREYEILADAVSFTHRGERHFSAAPGVKGGLPGASARSVIVRSGGRKENIPSKALTVLNKGDRVIVETPGGGGYGDPRRRTAVAVDVANGKVSEDAAVALYGADKQR